MNKIVSAALIALPIAFASASTFAAPLITFTSTGTFSNPTGATVNNGGSTVDWPGITGNHSYMAAGNYTGDFAGASTNPGTHIEIGAIDWSNSDQDNSQTTVTFNYALKLNFTSPNPGGSTTDTFNLTVTNTANNALVCGFFGCSYTGDVNDTTSGFSGTTLSVDGFTLSNLSFSVTSGGTFNSSTGTWSNPEGNVSTLTIYADIQQNVPEPMSLALLGTGLAGLGMVRRRTART